MALIGNPGIIDTVADNSTTALDNVASVTAIEIGDQTFIYAASWNNSGIQVLSLADDGMLTPISATYDTAALALNRPDHLTTITLGGDRFLVSAGVGKESNGGGGLSVFRIDATSGSEGSLTATDTMFWDDPGIGDAQLSSSIGLAAVESPFGSFVVVASNYFGGYLSVLELDDTGSLTVRDVLSDDDDAAFKFGAIQDVATAQVGSRNYVYATGDAAGNDGGISAFRMLSNGTLSSIQNIDDDPAFSYYYELETAATADGSFLFAAGIQSSASQSRIASYSIGTDGTLTIADEISAGLGFAPIIDDFTTFTLEGNLFLSFASSALNRVGIVAVGEDGTLQRVAALQANSALSGVNALTAVVIGDRPILVAGNSTGDSVVSLEVGGGSDVLVGDASDEALLGLNGNDTLEGRGGADTHLGGDGQDWATYASSGEGVSVSLLDGTATGGDAEGDTFDSIENLEGSAQRDELVGDNGVNQMFGGRGRDLIIGNGGNDRLSGKVGNDTIFGGDGRDRIEGHVGDDKLTGGAGADVFFFRSVSFLGSDRVTDFDLAEDRIDLRGFASFGSVSDVRAAAEVVNGTTVIDLEGLGTVRLSGIDEADLTNANFLFA